MKSRPSITCDPTLLRQSLDECLSETEEELLSTHLSTCEACQRELEKLAGQPAAWTRVGAALKAAGASRAWSLSGVDISHPVDSDSETDFAVEWLEPSSLAESIGRLV